MHGRAALAVHVHKGFLILIFFFGVLVGFFLAQLNFNDDFIRDVFGLVRVFEVVTFKCEFSFSKLLLFGCSLFEGHRLVLVGDVKAEVGVVHIVLNIVLGEELYQAGHHYFTIFFCPETTSRCCEFICFVMAVLKVFKCAEFGKFRVFTSALRASTVGPCSELLSPLFGGGCLLLCLGHFSINHYLFIVLR